MLKKKKNGREEIKFSLPGYGNSVPDEERRGRKGIGKEKERESRGRKGGSGRRGYRK